LLIAVFVVSIPCGMQDSRQRTIYEYHRVEINMSQVASNSAVVITPLPSKLCFTGGHDQWS